MNRTIAESKLLIFDLGNVIIDIDMQATLDAFRALGISGVEQHVTQSHSVGGIFTLFEQGKISPDEFCNHLRQIANINATNQQIILAWNAMLGSISASTVRLIERLKQQHTVVLLSNTNKIHFDSFDSKAQGYSSLSELFDKTWYSHEMHLSKPDKKIFEEVLSYHKTEPQQTSFFDDSEANIRAAQELGINSFLVSKDKGGINQWF